MYSWATRSSSSVVTPGRDVLRGLGHRLCGDPAGDAHRLDGLGVWTSGPVYGVGAGLPTYSGRRMFPGTERVGESSPGTSSDWPDMPASLTSGLWGSMAPWRKEPIDGPVQEAHGRQAGRVVLLPGAPEGRGRPRVPRQGPVRPLRHPRGGRARDGDGAGAESGVGDRPQVARQRHASGRPTRRVPARPAAAPGLRPRTLLLTRRRGWTAGAAPRPRPSRSRT